MDIRPERIRIKNELGKSQSLLAGTDRFDRFGNGPDVLVLGLGPEPALTGEVVATCMPHASTVYYLECPEFVAQMPEGWHNAIPAHWKALSPADCTPDLLSRSTVLLFTQNPRLFPSFWGPLVAAAQLAHLRSAVHTNSPVNTAVQRCVILPGDETGLLIRELHSAFTDAGWQVVRLAVDDAAAALPGIVAHTRPALFFSVNGQGLDMYGERQNLLQAAGCAVGIWCVDTPWHILSGFKTPVWKQAHLFVTDHTFIPAIEAAGARTVTHLPLATDPTLFAHEKTQTHDTAADITALHDRVVFVGRSEFPHRSKYFSGITPPDALLEEAKQMLQRGERPDYHWWAEQEHTRTFWPDTPRNIGAGAEAITRHWRARCLLHAIPYHLTVFGDAGWQQLVPQLDDLRPPVDYYTSLAPIYRHASVSLNCTGMLLPGGLTQRHFDVWAAGGLLLTDATPGMHIFPRHLVEAVSFRRAEELPSRINHVLGNRYMADQLRSAWRAHILAEHTYNHRVDAVLRGMRLHG